MNLKKIALQVLVAIALYVAISLILEKDYNQEILYREILEGLVFGLVYGIIIWLSAHWRKKKKSED